MRILFLLLLLLVTTVSRAAEVVRVGAYEFAPYSELDRSGNPEGALVLLLDRLNSAQNKYDFQIVSTAPRRRYDDLTAGRFDVMFFENPAWGWTERKIPLAVSNEFLSDSEVFIALAMPGRNQDYFTSFDGKSIAGILGYHYAFAGFNSDPKFLESNHRMSLVYNNQTCIQLVLSGRTELAVVTRSFLNSRLRASPELKNKLLVSQRTDQIYSHRAIVRPGAPISVKEIESLLGKLKSSGKLDEIWRRVGIIE